ncbi:hypothetical protein [Zavarzinia compransoris]|uniref:DUF883 domain-containing protein n=1 Tax=Zavarzinia compransoris TaxID=1264899 RepID=A0A317EAS1_9PROT|nr:hypothetical protein [Zavarzinia compransoris]PWR24049.1 hypothetical protein DKG75_05775 [Zavarzinia compransoris]TDP48312.1 hypothetical protein DES42_102615 [Zavarzinia compransoris]
MASNSANSISSEAYEALRADVEALRASLSDAVGHARKAGSDGAAAAVGEARAAAGKAGALLAAGRDGIGDAVKAQPVLACTISLGIGALIGAALFGRR